MSDFWSGIFLVGIIFLAILLLLIASLGMLRDGKNQRLSIISFGIVVTLLSVWIIDRFIVGAFCLPWECTKQEIDIESFLLDKADLPDNWSIRDTYNYAYVPRASSSYIERIFHKDSKLLDGGFIQEIYEYRSVRGASFQYEIIKYDFPKQYIRVGTEPELFQMNIPDNHASQYIIGYLYGSPNVCYYIAQYDELIVVLKMLFSSESAPLDDFINIALLVDEELSHSVRSLDGKVSR